MNTLESLDPLFDLQEWLFLKKWKSWVFKICGKKSLRPLILIFFEKRLRPLFFEKLSSPPPLFFFDNKSSNAVDGPGPGYPTDFGPSLQMEFEIDAEIAENRDYNES